MTIALSAFSAGKSLPLRRPPMFGEPAHGWLVAHVAQNMGYSVRQYAESLGFNGRYLQPSELLYWMKSLDLRNIELAEAATPIFQGNDVIIMGQSLRKKQWSIDRRRFCPACLAESPYHRTWWDIVPFLRCPFHGLDLTSTDYEGTDVPWWWPSFETSPNLKSIRRYGVPRDAELALSLETYILMRLGVVAKDRQFSVLDSFETLGEVLQLVENLKSILGWEPISTLDARGVFTCIADGREAIFGAIERLATACLAKPNGKMGVRGLYGERYFTLRANKRRGENIDNSFEYIDDFMCEVAHNHGFSSWSCKRKMGSAKRISFLEIAQKAGVQPETVKKAFHRFGIRDQLPNAKRGETTGITPHEVDRFFAIYATLKTADEAASILGIERKLFDGLVRIGKITVATKRKNTLLYLSAEVEAIACDVDQAPLVMRVTDDLVRLGDLPLIKHEATDFWLALALDAGRATFSRCGSGIADLLVDRHPEGRQRAVKVRR